MVEAASMDKPPPRKTMTRKRKKKTKSPIKEKTMKLDTGSEPIVVLSKQNAAVQKTECPQVMFEGLSTEEIGERYPILTNEELVQRFLNVPINNNQKGRIRQILRDNLKGTSEFVLPDVIHDRIQSVLKSSADLTDTDLRKIRILYNMLKTAIKAERTLLDKKLAERELVVEKKTSKKEKEEIDKVKVKPEVPSEKKEQLVKRVRGKKRYVVFIGNLPLDVNKEKIMKHFSEMNEHIVDIRIPKAKEAKKSAIAYVELKNEPTYELALSKHHSMLDNRRINVLYSTQKNSKISKAEAKSKSAKLVALQRSGKLIGSTPQSKKRSHRRAILKRARAKEAQA